LKNKHKAQKLLIILIITTAFVICLWVSYSYSFFKYGLTTDTEQIKIYNVVCKNMNTQYQRINYFMIDDEKVTVGLCNRLTTNLLYSPDVYDSIDYETMYDIYGELKKIVSKKIYVSAGGKKGDYRYTLADGILSVNKYSLGNSEEHGLNLYELLFKSMNSNHVSKVYISDNSRMRLDSINKALPDNTKITYLRAFSSYDETYNVIGSFKGLETLVLTIVDGDIDNEADYSMLFLNDLPMLNRLFIKADISRLRFEGVNCEAKSVVLYTDEELKSENFQEYFPNAEVIIAGSDYPEQIQFIYPVNY